MFNPIPVLLCDFYKISHRKQYPENTSLVYSNFTPRNSKYYKGFNNKIIFFGLKYFIKKVLIDLFNDHFFNKPIDQIIYEYTRVIKHCLNDNNPDTLHIYELHQLGYLPLEIKSLPELSLINYNVPVLTIKNTHPNFYWLTNFIETALSCDLWMLSNNATLAYDYRQLCENYANITCDNNNHIDFQCHDFSFRGMAGQECAIMSGMAHLTQFKGTDTIPAISAMEYYYNKNIENELVGCSIPASEHSVMCAGGMENEFDTYRRFIEELYPSGLISIVSDTWDFFGVLTNILPKLKDKIMSRDGKVVIRPDSGDPVDIICGKDHKWIATDIVTYYDHNKQIITKEEALGTIEILWELFGGTVNGKGYKVLDPHIGLIYGDSITLERAQEIFKKLEAKGFASSNIVFGVGSYTYQYNTRDSQGWAVKATYCEINGEGHAIFKEPKTDSNKKSAKGLLKVEKVNEDYILIDNVSWGDEKLGELKTVFLNSNII